ncbi:cryptochrome/photolyase family protein [Paenibacillus nasutitermitis]|uniref:Deoxyribodipyrimidine photo-lyase n=1 Tax=Paenibacillus nasutitermitis TaxID=1652958 RepID=A0A917E2A5_9BACL|nr:deoxyribodipyrimidine photo-lyase [Paenibacillus nasutitermitis]GGD95885.1 deoxyribodipyrimidine photo-lyase [Paenibacillus nasutitermitis]
MYLYIHRKDLRLNKLPAFDATNRRGGPGIHLLLFDPLLIGGGRLDTHSGKTFLRGAARLHSSYREAGQTLHMLYGEPVEVVQALLAAHPIAGIAMQADYTPYARQRDDRLQATAEGLGRGFIAYNDAPLVDLADFQHFTGRSGPYKVFTPFHRMWESYLRQFYVPSKDVSPARLETITTIDPAAAARFSLPPELAAALEGAGAEEARDRRGPSGRLADFMEKRLENYAQTRDDYALEDGTSGLARWLNSGALSVREVYEAVHHAADSAAWVRQLAWRDFYLYQARFNPDYFAYEQQFDLSALSDEHFAAWAQGKTGIPIIDAAMTQLRETGGLPNRLRMITAMFLTKNLLCPFTSGEDHFRSMLADYDNTQNRGGWLWSSSLGYDAAPYFRIMNPVTQSQRYDPSGSYIRRWLPQLAHLQGRAIHEPQPDAIVDLKASRARAIRVYKEILGNARELQDPDSSP